MIATVYVTKNFGFRRGEIYFADLDPHYGSEQGGKRPVIVIQNNTRNKFALTVIVAAVTSKVTKKPNQPTHVLIDRNPAFSRPSMVLLEQIFTIDKERIQRLLGQTTPDEMYHPDEQSGPERRSIISTRTPSLPFPLLFLPMFSASMQLH